MPILPLNYPEPFAATIGVMLYPAKNEEKKARAAAASYLVEPIRMLHEAGQKLPYEKLISIYMDSKTQIDDRPGRYWGGRVVGEALKVLFALSNTDPTLASWENAFRVVETQAARAKGSGSRALFWAQKKRFLTVAHLWGALAIRRGQDRKSVV